MALSNWDTLAIDHKGEPTDGSFTSPAGVVVHFYKNWLYIQDPQAWRKGTFTSPTVGEIQFGSFRYLDVHIMAFRGPQNGIYAVVWSGWEHDNTLQGMIGMGVYGFEGEDWVGVQPESVAQFANELRRKYMYKLDYGDGEEREIETEVHGEVPKCFREMDWTKAVRFNQGDGFLLANMTGESGMSTATKPGESDQPIFLRMLGIGDTKEI